MSEKKVEIKIAPVQLREVGLWIRGLSPYISHKWSEKSIRMMAEKHAGNKTKTREKRDEEVQLAEGDAAIYRDNAGTPGFPAMALKRAMVDFAHDKESIPKTLVRKAIFVCCNDRNGVIPMEYESMLIRQDTVRLSRSSTDLRYRPMFDGWRAFVLFQINEHLLSVQDLIQLVNNAGFSIGIGEWRPEKNGDFGRFEVEPNSRIEIEESSAA